MAIIHCTECGAQLMPTMRICPQCGGRSFSDFAPIFPPESQQEHDAVGASAPAPNTPHELASQGTRLLAYFIDVVLINTALIALSRLISSEPSADSLQSLTHHFIRVLELGVVLFLGYFTFLEASAPGGSLGKRIFGLSVVDKAGEYLRVGQSFGRALVHFVLSQLWLLGPLAIAAARVTDDSVEMFLVFAGFALSTGPFIVALFDANRRTVVDRIYQHQVVKKKRP